ncbi:hypothetical protein ROZALSC1DRAFT_30886 [Rozella allomycis CSF55]|uniref:Uncharacterized protein n=1 Tax=Rozella allomycis (strain CSF55) TaxID=988480 RepID=A0A4P9YD77_ROZAC|nr:hypothetical protein ROZALSC1DRAFT_30886 [Rozella allomycis CSF55]
MHNFRVFILAFAFLLSFIVSHPFYSDSDPEYSEAERYSSQFSRTDVKTKEHDVTAPATYNPDKRRKPYIIQEIPQSTQPRKPDINVIRVTLKFKARSTGKVDTANSDEKPVWGYGNIAVRNHLGQRIFIYRNVFIHYAGDDQTHLYKWVMPFEDAIKMDPGWKIYFEPYPGDEGSETTVLQAILRIRYYELRKPTPSRDIDPPRARYESIWGRGLDKRYPDYKHF